MAIDSSFWFWHNSPVHESMGCVCVHAYAVVLRVYIHECVHQVYVTTWYHKYLFEMCNIHLHLIYIYVYLCVHVQINVRYELSSWKKSKQSVHVRRSRVYHMFMEQQSIHISLAFFFISIYLYVNGFGARQRCACAQCWLHIVYRRNIEMYYAESKMAMVLWWCYGAVWWRSSK